MHILCDVFFSSFKWKNNNNVDDEQQGITMHGILMSIKVNSG